MQKISIIAILCFLLFYFETVSLKKPETVYDTDVHFMTEAFKMADLNIGNVGRNPAVGCIITKDNRIVSKGTTSFGGVGPSAEINCLINSKEPMNSGKMYITMEPCCIDTKNCIQLFKNEEIKKVVVAMEHPVKNLSGIGIEALKQANIKVKLGILKYEAEKFNLGYINTVTEERPYVVCRAILSLDGKIATHARKRVKMNNTDAIKWLELYKTKFDAILIGSGSLVVEDPILICQIEELRNRTPIRIVIDTQKHLKSTHKFAQTAKNVSTWVATTVEPIEKIPGINYVVVHADDDGQKICLRHLLKKFVKKLNVTRLFVEPGKGLMTRLLDLDLVDTLMISRSGIILGQDAIPWVGDLDITQIDDGFKFEKTFVEKFEEEDIEFWDRIPY